MTAIDRAIIAAFESFSHRVQRATGMSCFVLAAICAVVWASIVILEMCDSIARHRMTGVDYVLDGFCVLFGIQYAFFSTDERDALDRLSQRVGNPRKVMGVYRVIRVAQFGLTEFVLFLFMLYRDRESFLLMSASAVFLCFLYFEACDPLPPCTGKIGEWFASMRLRACEEKP